MKNNSNSRVQSKNSSTSFVTLKNKEVRDFSDKFHKDAVVEYDQIVSPVSEIKSHKFSTHEKRCSADEEYHVQQAIDKLARQKERNKKN